MTRRPEFESCRSQRNASNATSSTTPAVRRLTVFGAGLMGAGIAQVAAQNGMRVVLSDVSSSAINSGRDIIDKSLRRVARKAYPDSPSEQTKFIDYTLTNLVTSTDALAAIKDADVVVEAVVESMPIKQELFAHLDAIANPSTIFASNTSSLSVTEIASATSEARRTNFGGLHFFNPVPQMRLVEVIRTPQTSDEAFNTLLHLTQIMKKTPVSCQNTPGFIVNRLLVPYLLEAIRMVERGEATAEDVDIAMKLGAGMPMGPFELADYVGLDTLKHIADGWRASRVDTGEINAHSVETIEMLDDKVSKGLLGRKSGEGFFKYER